MKLRIKELLSYLKKGDRVADIGCDHGYLLIEGIKQGVLLSPIGVEKQKGPYNRCLDNLKKHGLEADIRLGDGLKPLKEGEVDTLVIAGMGGSTIVDILKGQENLLKGFKQIILQPMNGFSKIRVYLKDSGFTLVSENILEDKFSYLFMVFKKGEWQWSDPFMLEIGPFIYENRKVLGRLYLEYVERKIKSLEAIKQGLKKGNDEEVQGKKDELEVSLKKWEELYHD